LGKIKLGAPSASPGGDLMDPQQWLTWFYGNCSACHFDFQNFHIYDCNVPYYDAGGLNYWLSVASSFGKPVWLTEFDCPSPPDIPTEIDWMQIALQAIDSNPNVTRYAWFTARANNYVGTIPSLFTSSTPTSLTQVGVLYNSAGNFLVSPDQIISEVTSTQSSSSTNSRSSDTITSSSNIETSSSNSIISSSPSTSRSTSNSGSSNTRSSSSSNQKSGSTTSNNGPSLSSNSGTSSNTRSSSTSNSGTYSNTRTSSNSSNSTYPESSSCSIHSLFSPHILVLAIASLSALLL
jgi:hypothetical protein